MTIDVAAIRALVDVPADAYVNPAQASADALIASIATKKAQVDGATLLNWTEGNRTTVSNALATLDTSVDTLVDWTKNISGVYEVGQSPLGTTYRKNMVAAQNADPATYPNSVIFNSLLNLPTTMAAAKVYVDAMVIDQVSPSAATIATDLGVYETTVTAAVVDEKAAHTTVTVANTGLLALQLKAYELVSFAKGSPAVAALTLTPASIAALNT